MSLEMIRDIQLEVLEKRIEVIIKRTLTHIEYKGDRHEVKYILLCVFAKVRQVEQHVLFVR